MHAVVLQVRGMLFWRRCNSCHGCHLQLMSWMPSSLSSYVVMQNDDGASRGCGVVDFQSAGDALRAISQLSNSMLDGSQIHVREYRDDQRGGPPGGSQDGGRGPGREGEVQIVVHGLPYAMVWQGLKDLVREHSRVEAARATITMGSDGRSKGWGLVLLRNMDDAHAAIQVHRVLVYDTCITVTHRRSTGSTMTVG